MVNGNSGTAFRFTASGVIGTPGSSGNMLGVLTGSSTAGTLTLVDGQGATQVNALPLTAGQFVPIPWAFVGPVTVTLGGAADFTLFVLN